MDFFASLDWTFYAVAIPAAMMVGMSKSGLLGSFGFLGVPILAFVMPAREAAGLLLPMLIAFDMIALYNYRREISWPNIRVLLPGALTGILVGVLFWQFTTEAGVRFLVGIIAIVFVLDAWLKRANTKPVTNPSKPLGLFWGAVAGFTSFVSHTGGPPFQVYVLPQRLSPAIYAGTATIFFTVLNLVKLVPYYFLGQLNVSALSRAAFLLPFGIVAMLLGIWIVRRINPEVFYKLTYVLALIVGFKLVLDALGEWFGFAIF